MDLLDSFLLGIIQGLTEFLPISSSGHLVLVKNLLSNDLDKSLAFEIIVHFGTLCSILLYYRKKLLEIARSLLKLLSTFGSYRKARPIDPNVVLSGYILISMLPAVIVGYTMKDYIEQVFLNPFMVSVMLMVTGSLLFATRFRHHFPNRISTGNSFAIGLAQAFAILPGISRSGSTISLGLYLGVNREEVANFSFLMVIPIIAGAMAMQLKEMIEVGIQFDTVSGMLVGFFAAFVSGYFALKYLIIMLKTKGIYPFAWYCWLIGGIGLYYFS